MEAYKTLRAPKAWVISWLYQTNQTRIGHSEPHYVRCAPKNPSTTRTIFQYSSIPPAGPAVALGYKEARRDRHSFRRNKGGNWPARPSLPAAPR